MTITFGSIGDIIAVSLLISNALKTIKNSRGARSDYQKTIDELGRLSQILFRVKAVFHDYGDMISPQDPIVRSALVTLEECYTRMNSFSKEIAQYEKSLKKGSTARWFNVGITRLKWQILESDHVPQFRRDLEAHCNFISMLLSGAGV